MKMKMTIAQSSLRNNDLAENRLEKPGMDDWLNSSNSLLAIWLDWKWLTQKVKNKK